MPPITATLSSAAQAVLRGNDAGSFTRPGPNQYPHQWNWDSAVIALGLSYFDLPRALTEIRSLLSGQWRDGMLPHVVYHSHSSDYFPDPVFWQIGNSPHAPDVATSGITQPPLLASIVRIMHSRTPIPAFVSEVHPALLRWHRWLHTARDADGSGLACLIHPWESGTDDSPRWLQVMANMTPSDLPAFRRGDMRYVLPSERPYQADYERFIHLIDIFRQVNYDSQALLAQSHFLVEDVLFNAILFRADEDLLALGEEIGADTDEIEGWLAQMRTQFNARCWDETHGLYFDFDARRGEPVRVNTAVTFVPLYAGLASQEQARRLLEEHWANPGEYAPGDQVRYRLTTTSMNEPAWEARRYWRGPVWILLNWLVYMGMLRYGYVEQAEQLRRDSLSLMERAGFREYYDPRDGTGCGSSNFSWSAALAIEFALADRRI